MTQQLEKIVPGTEYTVQSGDTRKSIAMRAYNNSSQWRLISNANKTELVNYLRRPLPAGLKLRIPPKGGGGQGGGNVHIEGN